MHTIAVEKAIRNYRPNRVLGLLPPEIDNTENDLLREGKEKYPSPYPNFATY